MGGLSTTGYPMASISSRADSAVKATRAFGVGTPWFTSAMVVRNLFPHTRATS